MNRMLFIVNPRSGKGQIKNQLLTILDIFNKGGWDTQVHITQAPLDAMETAAKLGGQVDLVACSGGDGTLSETIAGLMQLDQAPALGYIPAGSTNDFASSLGISSNMKRAAANIIGGRRRSIDIGRFCGDRYFVYVAGFGAFTEVSYLTSQDKKNVLGHQAYMLEGVKSLVNLKSYKLRVEAEQMTLEGEFIFGMITNTISVGGFKGLVPQDVALSDGLFEVLLVHTPKTPLDLSNIINYMFLKEEQNEYVYKFKTSHLRILSEEPVDWVLDGEYGGSRREVEVENLSKRIDIVVCCHDKMENR